MRSFLPQLLAPTVLTLLALAGSACAGPVVPHKESTDGRLTFVRNPTPANPVGRMEFVATGRATHMGRYTQVGGHNFTADGRLRGRFVSTAADGSTISGFYFGTFVPLPGNRFRFDVTAVWVTGTGRLVGVTGRGGVVAILDGTTQLFHYDTNALWELP